MEWALRKKSNHQLTSREAELLQLIAEGHVNKQIASELGISIKTVEKHRQHLMEKLNIHDIAGLTRFAIAAGIIESSVQSTIAQDAPSKIGLSCRCKSRHACHPETPGEPLSFLAIRLCRIIFGTHRGGVWRSERRKRSFP